MTCDRTTAIWGLTALLASSAVLAGAAGALGEPGDSVGTSGGPAVTASLRPSPGAVRPASLPAPLRAGMVTPLAPAPRAPAADQDDAIKRAMLRAKCAGLEQENARLREEADGLRRALADARARLRADLAVALGDWLDSDFAPDDFILPSAAGPLDLRRDVHDALLDSARRLELGTLDALRARLGTGGVRDLTRELALWYEESIASGRQDFDERARRVEALLGLPPRGR